MSDWNPTHTIAVREPSGEIRITLVEIQDGVCYASDDEAQGFSSSDWTYTDEDGLLFQGQAPIGESWLFKHLRAPAGVPNEILAASDRAWTRKQAHDDRARANA